MHVHSRTTTVVGLTFCPAPIFAPARATSVRMSFAQVTSTHVGMLVCGLFNASVASESMGKGFKFDMAAGEWRGVGGQVIGVGGDTQFVVTR